MDWKAQRPAIEIAAEWIAAACVGGAGGFACWMLAPAGAGWLAAPAAGGLGAAATLFALGRVDARRGPPRERFVPIDFADAAELAGEGDEALLLDDPLPALDADSRVVRLFAVAPTPDEPTSLPGPGEMAARIETFLGGSRGGTAAADPVAPAATDASAALHAALADIRRSLRQA
jgi:hypothetical protein